MTDGVAHIGCRTAPEARGRGLTSDALRTITRWFLHERGAARVELVVEPANNSSVRVAEAAGRGYDVATVEASRQNSLPSGSASTYQVMSSVRGP